MTICIDTYIRPQVARRLAACWLAALCALPVPAAAAAGELGVLPPVNQIRVFERDSGERSIAVPINFGNVVLGFDHHSVVSIMAAPGSTAVGGAACTPGVDFIARDRTPFVVPAGTTGESFRLRVVVCGDTRAESDQSLLVFIAEAPDGDIFCGDRCATRVRVLDDDGPRPSPRISVGDATVKEGRFGNSEARVRLTLTEIAPKPVSVRLRTSNLSATAPRDYSALDTVVQIPSETLSVEVPVTIKWDVLNEPTESFAVDISDARGAVLGTSRGIVSIIDRDALAQALLHSLDLSFAEALRTGADQTLSLRWTLNMPGNGGYPDVVDIRLHGPLSNGEFLRWSRVEQTLAVCQHAFGMTGLAGEQARTRQGARCGARWTLGRPGTLKLGEQLILDLERTRRSAVDAKSGVEGLELVVRLNDALAGSRLDLQVGALEFSGNEQAFQALASLQIQR